MFVAHEPNNTLRKQLKKIKDQMKKEDCTGVVYSIPCKDCDMSYVGQTKRKLETRIKEHKRDVRNSSRLSNLD